MTNKTKDNLDLNKILEVKIMRQNYNQRIEMQIPKENFYSGMSVKPNPEEKLNDFLKNNFEFPSNNIVEINKFISKDLELEKIIKNLPKIISKELSYNSLSLDFMKETDPNEKILEIIIFSKLNEEQLLEKEDKISDNLIEKYQTVNEYIILVEPYVEQ